MTKTISKLLILVLLSCNSPVNNKKGDAKVLFEIIFADGFKSDEIVFTINGNKIIQSVLKSNESDGLTSLAYKIIVKEDRVNLINSYEDYKTYLINDKQKIELSVLYEGKLYNYILQEDLGKYVLIELNNVITFNQQRKKPIFD